MSFLQSVVRRREMILGLAVAAASTAARGQVNFTFQHTNSISLGAYFFGPGNNGVGSPSSGYGSNPLSIAFDGTNAYIGGFNTFGTADNIGVVELSNVLGTSPTGAGLPATQVMTATTGQRGVNDMIYDPTTQRVYYAFDSGSTNATVTSTATPSLIARLNPGTGTLDWTMLNPDGQRPVAIGIDPRGNTGGAPAVGYLARGTGRDLTLDPSTGAPFYTTSGTQPAGITLNPGPIINGTPQPFASTWRSENFDSNGDIVAATGQNGTGATAAGIDVGLRTGNNQFTTLTGTQNLTSNVIVKSNSNDNIGNGVVFFPNLVSGATGVNANVLVFAAPTTTSQNFTQTLTDSQNNVTTINTRQIQIRDINGTTTGLTQTALTGAEDDLGAAFTADQKNFAVGTDANGLPVLLTVDEVSKRLDIYSVEPTWTTGNGNFSSTGNWEFGVVPNSQLLNAKFGVQTGATTVNINQSFTTKDLKIDSSGGSYTLAAGGGTITLNGPDTHTANFQILSGNQTINAPVALINAGGIDALVSPGASLTLNGAISGSANLHAGAGGTLTINGDNSAGYSGATTIDGGTTVAVNNANALGAQSGNLTINGGTLVDTVGFTTSRNLIIGANGATLSVPAGTETRTGSFGGSGSFTKIGAGTAQVSPFTITGLTVSAGTLRLNAGQNTTSLVTSLNVGDNTSATTAKLDLNDEDMVVEYSGSSSPIDIVRTLLTTGFNAGNWNGNGIASLAANQDPNHHTGLGYAENSDLNYSQFGTVPVDGTSLLIKYTYYGDSNLDGVVDSNDFALFLNGLTNNGSTWDQGDYTYDGTVDLGNDFNLFLINYLNQGGQLGTLAAMVDADSQLSQSQRATLLSVVPEPSSAVGLALLAGAMSARRRKRASA